MSIISNAKEIAGLVKKLGDIELYRKIIELEREIIGLTHEKRESDDEVIRMKILLDKTEEMTWNKPFYYVEGDETPFCAPCWEVNKVQVHLKNTGKLMFPWKCPICHTGFGETP